MSSAPEFTRRYVNLAAPESGAAIVSVSDEFFAPARRMLADSEPQFVPGRYDAHGKWMDGWESRRRRGPGHDHCILRICPGVVRGVDIDTRHFTGNFPPEASLEACSLAGDPDEHTRWHELVPRRRLEGDSHHFVAVADTRCWTHLRLNLYPDGGIARLRVYGQPRHERLAGAPAALDLASAAAGGRALACNNMHFGDMANLLSNHPAANMGDGWETRRRREAGNDWVIIRLGKPGRISRVVVDTSFFKGNYPARCAVSGAALADESRLEIASSAWPAILGEVALGPDQVHVFESQVRDVGVVTHVRFDIFPDGGVARLRLLGVPAAPGHKDS
jgi:allantoicase